MRQTAIYIFTGLLLAVGALAYASCENADDPFGGGGSDSDSDSDSDGDSDGDGDGDGDGDMDTDNIWDPEYDCDCPDVEGATALDYANAMNVCEELGFLDDAELVITSSSGELGLDAIPSQGTNSCLVKQHGCQMFALSTGPVGQADPNMAEDMGGLGDCTDPIPDYQGDSPSGGTDGEVICDLNQLRLVLTAPQGSEGFSFDFLFASAEYNEWINMGFNDTFYAILEHPDVNGGATTNISFDSNDNEIEVDVNFFENSMYPCDETGSGWEPAMPSVSGSTGWLRTTYPVQGGDTFALTFSIHDEGDCVWDSIVFIDNFQWSGEPVVNETTPIE